MEASKKQETTDILIDGRVYPVAGAEPQKLQQMAAFINRKLKDIRNTPGFRRLDSDYKEALVYINLAEEYFNAAEEIEALKKEAEERDRELYAVRHDLVSVKLKLENALKQQSILEGRLEEYRKRAGAGPR